MFNYQKNILFSKYKNLGSVLASMLILVGCSNVFGPVDIRIKSMESLTLVQNNSVIELKENQSNLLNAEANKSDLVLKQGNTKITFHNLEFNKDSLSLSVYANDSKVKTSSGSPVGLIGQVEREQSYREWEGWESCSVSTPSCHSVCTPKGCYHICDSRGSWGQRSVIYTETTTYQKLLLQILNIDNKVLAQGESAIEKEVQLSSRPTSICF